MDRPETRYAQSGDLKIAYQTLGDGPLDLVVVPAMTSNIEIGWDLPYFNSFLRRLASFSRLILFDRRGNGMSEGIPGTTPLEGQMDDVLAVLEAADAPNPVLIAPLEGSSLSTMFAASRPDVVRALVMMTPNSRPVAGPGYEWAQSVEERNERVKHLVEYWGMDSPENLFMSDAISAEERFIWTRWQRLAMGPSGVAASLALHGETDVRELLPSIQCPTLVIRPQDDVAYDKRHSTYVAEHVPGATYVETPGAGPLWIGAVDEVADEIQQLSLIHI